MTDKIITKSAELLTSRYPGFHQIASIPDENGINSTLFKEAGKSEVFMVVSKKYAYNGLASFQLRQIREAKKRGLTLVFYEDESETFTAFLPDMVLSYGDTSFGQSKLAHVEWRELSLEYGVPIRSYLDGKTPAVPGAQSGLGAFQ
jgi:hypothetical protein